MVDRVGIKVAQSFELYVCAGGHIPQCGFDPSLHDVQRIRVEIGLEVSVVAAWGLV